MGLALTQVTGYVIACDRYRLNNGNLKAGLSLGWTKEKLAAVFKGWGAFFNKLLGIFISGLLISFGAPFWHDLLSTFSGFRRMLQENERRKPAGSSPPAGSP